MKQTTKTLVTMGGLAALALAVAFAAAWVGKDEEQKADAKEKSEKLFKLYAGDVRDLKVSKGGKLAAELKRDDEKAPWKVVAPIQADADAATVSSLVDKLVELKQKSQVDGMDLKVAGVADEATSKLAISMTDAAGKTQELLVGEENPFDKTTYARKQDETVVRVLAKPEATGLDKSLFDLRDKRVAHIDEASGLSKLEVVPETAALGSKGALAGALQAGNFDYALERDGTKWKLTKPVAGPADSGTIDRLISSVKNLRGKSIASETGDAAALAQYGLAFPKETVLVTVASADGKDSYTRKLLIGQPALTGGAVTLKTYAKREDAPTIFEVDGQILKDLARELFELQDKTVQVVEREAVRRIEYAAPGKDAIVISRSKEPLLDGGAGEEKFALVAPKAGPAKKFKISGNLYALTNLKAAAFDEAKPSDAKELAKLGLDHPRTVTLFGDNDAVLGKLLIGAETGAKDKKRHFALVENGAGSGRVFELDSSVVDDFPQKVEDALEAPPPTPAATSAGPMSAGGTVSGGSN